MKYLLLNILIFLGLLGLSSCIEDGVDTSPSAQPEFSVDTLKMGLAFTAQGTPTHHFTVKNNNSKIISISSITLRNDDRGFRLNVDGQSGRSFQNVEIRPNDSIYVFVEATPAATGKADTVNIEDNIDFLTNGVTSTVVVQVTAQDVKRQRGVVIDRNTRWEAGLPYQIYDSLIIEPQATLTLAAGCRLYFHDKAIMRVDGRIISQGTTQQPVILSGDRTDNVVGDLSFDLMASQWGGIIISAGSRDNKLSHTQVRNTSFGIYADSLSSLELYNCNLRNSADRVLTGYFADIKAVGTVLSEAVSNVVALQGGTHIFNHCTFANYYLRHYPSDPLLLLAHAVEAMEGCEMPLMKADISNCIFYGLSDDIAPGDLTGSEVIIHRCLFKSAGQDNDNFLECLWDQDPLYYTDRDEYIFDYRLKPESPAALVGYSALMLPEAEYDFYGVRRNPDNPSLGAYEYVEPPEENTEN